MKQSSNNLETDESERLLSIRGELISIRDQLDRINGVGIAAARIDHVIQTLFDLENTEHGEN